MREANDVYQLRVESNIKQSCNQQKINNYFVITVKVPLDMNGTCGRGLFFIQFFSSCNSSHTKYMCMETNRLHWQGSIVAVA